MKHKILAIVGESGSGKTTLALELQSRLNIPSIVSYTTRPMRRGEINGREHWFVGENQIPASFDNVLAYTRFGGYYYWAEYEQLYQYPVLTYVIDEKGLHALKQWEDELDIVTINVVRENNPIDGERRDRDNERVAFNDYNIVIYNNGTIEEFIETGIEKIKQYI